MNEKKSLVASLTGAGVSLVFCFSPLLVLLLGGAGLSSWFGWIDSGFHALFVVSVAAGIYMGVRTIRRKHTAASSVNPGGV